MKKLAVSLVLAAVVVVTFGLTLKDYGLDEDTPFHFLRGQAYLEYFLTGRQLFVQPKLASPVLFVPGQRVSAYKLSAWESNMAPLMPIIPGVETVQAAFRRYLGAVGRESFYKHNSWSPGYFIESEGVGHPPVGDLLGALTNRIFYERLGWVGDIEGYYVWVILTSALAVGTVYWFATRLWGAVVGFFSSVSLFLFPAFFAEGHFNVKDVPEMAFFAVSLATFYLWVEERKARWLFLTSAAFYLAVGTTWTALFLPIVIFLWFLTARNTPSFERWLEPKRVVSGLVAAVLVGAAFVLSWPYLWTDILARLQGVFSFYSQVSESNVLIQRPVGIFGPMGITLTLVAQALATIPPLTLLLFLVGFWVFWRTRSDSKGGRPRVLVAWWLTVPLLFTLRPYTANAGSTRQFTDYLPALCIFAGWGAGYLLEKLELIFPKRRRLWGMVMAIIYLSSLVWVDWAYSPNQNVYFNFLVGGLAGAKEKELATWQTNYHNANKEAVRWLDQNASSGAQLAYLDGSMQSISSLWLRDDIQFASSFSGFGRKGEYAITGLFFPGEPAVFPYLYLTRFLRPIYEVKRDGVVLAAVYKNSKENVKDGYLSLMEVKPTSEVKTGRDSLGDYWEASLPEGKTLELTDLVVRGQVKNCADSAGVFYLGRFMSPWRIKRADGRVEFAFAGESATTLRYYPLAANACLAKPEILGISAVKR